MKVTTKKLWHGTYRIYVDGKATQYWVSRNDGEVWWLRWNVRSDDDEQTNLLEDETRARVLRDFVRFVEIGEFKLSEPTCFTE